MLFVLLLVSPCTEPYSICTASTLLRAPVPHVGVFPPRVPRVASASRTDEGYPPSSLTDDQLKDSKDVIAPQELGGQPPYSDLRTPVIPPLIVSSEVQAAFVVLRM